MNCKLFLIAFLGAVSINSNLFAAHHITQPVVKAISATLREITSQASAETAIEDLIHQQATQYVLSFRHADADVNPGGADLPMHIKTDINEAKGLLDSSRQATLEYFLRNPRDLGPVGDIETLLNAQILFCQTDTLLRLLPPTGYISEAPATEELE